MDRSETVGCGPTSPGDAAPANYGRPTKNQGTDPDPQLNRLSLGGGVSQPPLRERVYNELYRAHANQDANQRRFERAQRAAELMEKHPEVAELVELLRDF